ncbi:hypothetical protein MNBD_BACTEROID06-759 [hydrothermal vent metagenome]|uniref:Four helix bundle protein n=1 Tax=hydrothermal vent metagenome TaxID=652676 RepID=A0A3B0UIL8_9ZZZZ
MAEKELFSKICIVVEEADEPEYWLEIIKEASLAINIEELNRLLVEINEILKIVSKTKSFTYG